MLKSEVEWGRIQIGSAAKDPDVLAAVIAGLVGDANYRKQADEAIAEIAEGAQPDTTPTKSVSTGEVRFAKAIWNGDASYAHETAQVVVDSLSGDDWAGYRCWWLYLGSVAARSAGNRAAQLEALKRAKAIGINSGWLDSLLRRAMNVAAPDSSSMDDARHAVAERAWNAIDELGWSGPKYGAYCRTMLANLAATSEHKRFHEGLVMLGKLLGAIAERPSGQGDPDVIWKFTDLVWICFEAKSEKLVGGAGLNKKDLLQASGHIEWINFFKSQGKGNLDVTAVVVAAEKKILAVAEPHKGSLYFLSITDALTWTKGVQKGLFALRTRFSGHDFGSVQQSFVTELRNVHCDFGSTLARIKNTLL
jgi:hypothetical protein